MSELQNLVARAFRPSGRFSRGEFARLFLGAHAISLMMGVVVEVMGGMDEPVGVMAGIMAAVFFGWLLFVLPLTVCLGIQRLHDLGKSGWFLVLAFVPLLNIVMMLYLLLSVGKPTGETKWG